jgi:titin
MYLFCLLDKPSAPQNLRVIEVNKDYVILAWDTPKHDGGSPITGYTIEKADTKRKNFTSAGTVDADCRQFKATKLIDGTEYLFKVCAENAIGLSEPAALAEPVTARLPFGE